jgi:hypothetical protein
MILPSTELSVYRLDYLLPLHIFTGFRPPPSQKLLIQDLVSSNIIYDNPVDTYIRLVWSYTLTLPLFATVLGW